MAEPRFLTPLDLRAYRPDEWVLLSPLRYQSGIAVIWGVPEGFITDLASIPRAARAMISPNGQSRRAAVLHDWLYCCQAVDRSKADGIFREALKAEGVSWVTRQAMWAAVRSGGWIYWNKRNSGLNIDDFAEIT